MSGYHKKLLALCVLASLGFALATVPVRTALWSRASDTAINPAHDPDVWLRLLKAEQVHEKRNFGEHLVADIAPPAGLYIHWTAPVDALLLAGAHFFAQDKGLRPALLQWSRWYPAVLFALFVWAVLACMVYMRLPPGALFFALGAALLNPFLAPLFMPGNVDHHNIQAVVAAALAAVVIRIFRKPDRLLFALAGALTGLGVWISVQFLLAAALASAALLIWWPYAVARYASRLAIMPACAAIVIAGALAIEYPAAAVFTAEYDMVSIAHFALFAGLGCAIALAGACTWRLNSPAARAIALAGLCCAAGLVLHRLFPGLFVPPLLPEFVRQVSGTENGSYYESIAECLPVWKAFPISIQLIFWLEFLAAGAVAVYYAVKSEASARAGWRFIAAFCIVAGLLTAREFRWFTYSVPFFIIPGAALCELLGNRLRGKLPPKRGLVDWGFVGSGLGALFLVCIMPLLTLLLPREQTNTADKTESSMIREIENGTIAKALGSQPATVLVSPGLAPLLVFWTPHKAVFGNYHRIPAALKIYTDFLNAASPQAALAAARAGNIEALFISPGSTLLPGNQKFAAALARGEIPDWLEPVPGYENKNGILLLRVNY
ncbi:MAG: hypothetical protein PHW69_06500 [Elusimicrobiaceae bacterium]|nr:hypothetical protein [Elusimicrobiaceae bacterium]